MLFTYGATAGVIVERVPQYGWDYLEQHRYIVFYQLANIAMVLQWLAVRHSKVDQAQSRADVLPFVTLVVVVIIQAGLSAHAWNQLRFIRAYHQGMAQTIFCLADHPDIQVPVCEDLHAVCSWRPEVRNHLVGILKQHRLNVFSEAFQLRHGMQPLPAEHDRCLGQDTAPPIVVNEVVDVRVDKNAEIGDRVVVGSILGTGFRQGDMVIVNNGSAFGTVFGNPSWVTFSIPASILKDDAITIHVVRPSTNQRSQNVTATVRR